MVKVLFDHNMPPVIARSLNELIKADGHEAVALRKKFRTNISDIDYYSELGKEGGWIVISKDVKQIKKPAERDAILRSGVMVFYLMPAVGKQRVNEQAATIIWQWDKILKQYELSEGGLFALPVRKGSKFKVL